MDVTSLLQALIRFPTITPHDGGAQVYLASLLTPLGFDVRHLPFDGRGSYPVDNVFARRGTSGPHLMFCGHMDVVPVGDETTWSVPPFEGVIKNGAVYGRGASDMKGNIAAFICALSLFLSETPAFKGSISLLITGDEEKDSINGTARVLEWMKNHNHIPDVALVGEPTNPNAMGDETKIGRRGSLSGTLTVDGVQGHVAYPHNADNPLPRLIALLKALTDTKFDSGSDFFAPTNLEITSIDVGNPAANVIPARGVAKFNVRFSDQWTAKTLEANIRAVFDSMTPNYTLTTTSNAESFLTTPGPWTDLVTRAVTDITGKTPALTTHGGTSDARFIAPFCPVVECGVINKTVHQVDEHCRMDDLEICVKIYHQILKLYFA